MLESIKNADAGKLIGNQDCYRVLSNRNKAPLRRDMERYVRSLPEDIESNIKANDLDLLIEL